MTTVTYEVRHLGWWLDEHRGGGPNKRHRDP
jgi:hypothetical protein